MNAPVRQGDAIEARRYGPFDALAIAGYAVASGDDNPLHTDPSIAAKAGLDRPPIHGMLIMGAFEAYLRNWRPDLRVAKISAKFIRPVLVGESFDVTGKVVRVPTSGPAVIRLTVRREGDARDLACLAEAFVAS